MKKIYLFLGVLFLIKVVDGQNCSPKNVPYTFSSNNDSCMHLYANGIFNPWAWGTGTNDIFTFPNYPTGTSGTYTDGKMEFDQGVNLVAGKKYAITIGSREGKNLGLSISGGQLIQPIEIYYLGNSNGGCFSKEATIEYSPTTSGIYYFTVRVFNYGGIRFYFSHLSIKEITCPITITNFQVSNITDSSATLKWQSNLPTGKYDIYYGPSVFKEEGCANSNIHAIVTTTSTNDSISLTGLYSNTAYDYSIRPHCDSANIGEWSKMGLFTTLCIPTQLPYTQQFNTSSYPSQIPQCTYTQNLDSNGGNWAVQSFLGNLSLKINSTPNYPSNAWYYIPKFYLDSSKIYRLSFNYFASDTTKIQSLEVKYGLAANNLAMNNLIVNLPSFKTKTSPTLSAILFSPPASGIYHIGFHNFDNINGGDFYIDDISITDINVLFVNSFLDKNSNNIKDPGETDFTDATFITQKNGFSPIVTATSGGYAIVNIDTGTYTTKVVHNLPYYTTSPLVHTTNLTGFLQTDTAIFAIQPIPGKRDLSVHLIPLNNARPGFTSTYQVSSTNQGTDTVQSGIAEMILDSRSSFISSTPSPTTISGDTLRWSFSGLIPSASSNIFVTLQLPAPPALNLNDVLTFSLSVSSEITDLTPADNSTKLNQIVRGSYDPNDKIESHGGSILKSEVDNGAFLQYTIRFQNTGNDSAFNVIIKDTLDPKLDWNSFRMLDASHNYQLTITDDNKCEWKFNNINLPDSNVNEKLSHGFVTFIVKIKSSEGVGSTISNRATIYFDYNLPIITNTEYTKVVANTLPLQLLSFTAKLFSSSQLVNESARKVVLSWNTANEINLDHFEVQKSMNGRNFTTIGKVRAGAINYSFTDDKLLAANAFYYRLKMIDKDGKFTFSPVRYIRIDNGLFVDLFPNPAKDKLQVVVNSDMTKATEMHVQVITDDGKVANNFKWEIQEGKNNKTIDISSLQKGNYYLKIVYSNNEYKTVKFKKL